MSIESQKIADEMQNELELNKNNCTECGCTDVIHCENNCKQTQKTTRNLQIQPSRLDEPEIFIKLEVILKVEGMSADDAREKIYEKIVQKTLHDDGAENISAVSGMTSRVLSRGEAEGEFMIEGVQSMDNLLSTFHKIHDMSDPRMQRQFYSIAKQLDDVLQYAGEYVNLDAPKKEEEHSSSSSIQAPCNTCKTTGNCSECADNPWKDCMKMGYNLVVNNNGVYLPPQIVQDLMNSVINGLAGTGIKMTSDFVITEHGDKSTIQFTIDGINIPIGQDNEERMFSSLNRQLELIGMSDFELKDCYGICGSCACPDINCPYSKEARNDYTGVYS